MNSLPIWLLCSIFVVFSLLGYVIIKQVPSLLHTPLMSGMNALSGITILGALIITKILYEKGFIFLGGIVGGLALVLAGINLISGFLVTDRMLKKFAKKGTKR